MAVYYGVVEHGAVRLPEEVHLPEGTVVEIHTAVPEPARAEQLSPEALVKQDLIEAGLLLSRPPSARLGLGERIEPIQVQGELLSEMIIRERR